jgi:molybdenum cofactor cytidylyltransferase
MHEFGVVVLAAGNSSRMGSAKQLLDYGGKPLLRHAVEVALASTCRRVIVVLGSQCDELRRALDGLPVAIEENGRWAEGMGTSIQAGVEAARRENLAGVILSLADQPLVTARNLNALVNAHLESGQPIVASRYSGTVGVPAFFSREFFPQLLSLAPSAGCKGVILSHAGSALHLDCLEAESDIDTPEDYARARRAMAAGISR